MARCDIYLQPSRHEGKPIVVEEAKILGKIICAANYKSAREQLSGVENSVICEINEDGIYGGIREILKNLLK